MDIAAVSMALSQQKVLTDVGTSVLRMSLDQLQSTNEEFTKMLEASVNPNLGQNIDISI